MTAGRIVLLAVLLALGTLTGWRVLVTTRADQLAVNAPAPALQWDQRSPEAWLALARRQLDAGERSQARASARRLLAIDPGQGKGFALLALASPDADPQMRAQLYRIAVRRAPRDLRVHGWLADEASRAGQPAPMLAQIDAILRLSPRQGAALLPLLAQLAADPRFAATLVTTLRGDPPWRAGLLTMLSSKAPAATADRVYGQLQAQGGLEPEDTRRWLDTMLQAGRWSTAYGHWAGIVLAAGRTRLPAVYNGDFEQPLTRIGFDWRLQPIPGVYTDVGPADGADGTAAAHVHFLGRPVARADLEQPLLLAPGAYRMRFRARALGLRSEQGLQWTLTCAGQPQSFAQGPTLDGDFDWRPWSMRFEVSADCPGQWLRLENPAPGGSTQMVSGDLWLDDVVVTPAHVSPPS